MNKDDDVNTKRAPVRIAGQRPIESKQCNISNIQDITTLETIEVAQHTIFRTIDPSGFENLLRLLLSSAVQASQPPSQPLRALHVHYDDLSPEFHRSLSSTALRREVMT